MSEGSDTSTGTPSTGTPSTGIPASGILASIGSPSDLKRLDVDQLTLLAAEIRDFLVAKVSRTGGHLGPNLGVVELTLALHRVFDSPRDRLLFDTGHQAYVHKIVTGRQEGFDLLRQRGGLSGYPSRAESDHDLIENSHASTALSATPTGWPRRSRCAARIGTWSPWSVTARSPEACAGRR